MSTTTFPPSTQVHTPRRTGLQVVAGVSLLLGGLLNGLPQYFIDVLATEGDSFNDQIRWGVDHAAIHQAEQLTILFSSLFMPIGLLGLAWVAHHHARRLTAVATVLVVWGMWGFHNVLAMGYTAGTVGPDAVGVEDAVRLNEALVDDVGVLASALFPHLIGTFFGLLLLTVACWRSGVFPRIPLLLMVTFLVWDFALPSVGAFEPHLLLAVSWAWLGVHLLRLPGAVWAGDDSSRSGDGHETATSY